MDFVCGGASALHKLEKGGWSVIVTDMKMPVVSGKDLYDKVSSLNHDCEFIIFSGQFSKSEIDYFTKNDVVFVEKPLPHEHIVAMILDAIEHRECRENYKKIWRK